MKITKQQKSIVIIGSFNPVIITPDWLLENKFITNGDFKQRNIDLINNEFSIFTIPDINIFVSREKFQLSSNRYEVSELLFDLCKNVMELLIHTPVTKLGVNQQNTYSLNNVEERNQLGYKLVPQNVWKEIIPTYEGMNLLRITAKRDDEYDGYKKISVGPSELDDNNVTFSINDHYELSGGCKQLCKIINDKSIPDDSFEKICTHILNSIRD